LLRLARLEDEDAYLCWEVCDETQATGDQDAASFFLYGVLEGVTFLFRRGVRRRMDDRNALVATQEVDEICKHTKIRWDEGWCRHVL
jgi:hypothetical protein